MTNIKSPIYIVSKGRWESRYTAKALEWMSVPYFIVVEKQEYRQYAKVIDKKKILVLDKKFQEDYDTCDDLGDTKSKGPGAARNFAWQHAIDVVGSDYHWVMDDNMLFFLRMNRGERIIMKTGKFFKCVEDFIDRYENVYISGLNYKMFSPGAEFRPPFFLNTRIYSCLFIRNDIPYRWRGRYNEDTDICLRVLKDGFCTVQFNAFLCEKLRTQVVKGGNTEEFYAHEGTMPKSQMLVDLHPDVSRIVWRFGRWHHYVDYSRFKKNKLIRKKGYNYTKDINEYGMKLIDNTKKGKRQ